MPPWPALRIAMMQQTCAMTEHTRKFMNYSLVDILCSSCMAGQGQACKNSIICTFYSCIERQT